MRLCSITVSSASAGAVKVKVSVIDHESLLGVSPIVAESIGKELGISAEWMNTAIMPFGVPTGGPGVPGMEKTFLPAENRVLDFE